MGLGASGPPTLQRVWGIVVRSENHPLGLYGQKKFFSEICPFFRLKFFDFFSLPESNSFFLNHFMLHIGCRAGIGDAESKKNFGFSKIFTQFGAFLSKSHLLPKHPPGN